MQRKSQNTPTGDSPEIRIPATDTEVPGPGYAGTHPGKSPAGSRRASTR